MKTLLLVLSIALAIFAGVAFYYMKNNVIGLIAFVVAAACFIFYRKQNGDKK